MLQKQTEQRMAACLALGDETTDDKLLYTYTSLRSRGLLQAVRKVATGLYIK